MTVPSGSPFRFPMLSRVPLPSWWDLYQAVVSRSLSDTELAAPWTNEGESAGWLSRSAWSLALIALWRQQRSCSPVVNIWIPDFFCNSSLSAVRQTGIKLVFYPLTERLSPDFAGCRKLATSDPPDVFILVHYFGQPTPAAPTRDFCGRHGAWLVEDAAHVLRPVRGVGGFGDFVLYSPHKHLPIPDGAVLVIRPNGPSQFGTAGLEVFGTPKGWPAQALRWATHEGCSSAKTAPYRTSVWLVKRVLQKMGVGWRYSAISRFDESVDGLSMCTSPLIGPSMSIVAKSLALGLFRDLGTVACRRQRNQRLVDYLLLSDGDFSSVLAPGPRPERSEWTPYQVAYRVDPAAAKTIYERWLKLGLPVTTWPDLPPEVALNRESHAQAWHWRHSCLHLTVHQSMSARRSPILHPAPPKCREQSLNLV